MTNLSAAMRLTGFISLSLIAMVIQGLILSLKLPGKRWVPHVYFKLVASLLSMRVIIYGAIPSGASSLILTNHASWLDVVALSSVAPVVFVAKSEVANWPFFGALAKLGGTIFIDRKRRQSTKLVHNLMQLNLTKGDSIVLFPEGTTSDGNRILPFRSALVGAAIGNSFQAAVIPALIAYSGRYGLPMNRADRNIYAWFGEMTLVNHLWRVLKSGPFDVTLCFYKPINLSQGRKAASHVAENLLRSTLANTLTGRISETALINSNMH